MTIISSDDSILIVKPDTCDYDITVNPDLLDFILYTQASTTATLSGNGLYNSKLQAHVKLSTNPDNILEVDSTGLLVLVDGIAGTDEYVKVTSSDTTAGHLSSKLSAGSGITFTTLNPGANEQLQVSFSGSFTFYSNDSSSIDFSGAGTSGSPLTAVSKISATSGNILSINSDGLYGTVAILDSTSIDLSGVGTSGSPISAVAKISANTNNGLSIQSDGLYASSVNSTITLSQDVTGSGTSSIVSTVVGIRAALIPTLSTGNLRYNGSAWIFDSASYLTAAGAVTSVAGTTSQVLVNGGTSAQVGAITLSLPQNIHAAANPTFNNLTLTGLATIGGTITSFASYETSDKRLKTLLEDNPLIDTSSITPKRYLKEGKEEIGYFAQDVQEILPFAVKQDANSFLSLSYRDIFVAKIYALEQRVKELEVLVNNLSNPF